MTKVAVCDSGRKNGWVSSSRIAKTGFAFLLLYCTALAPVFAQAGPAGRRFALVIGNASYQSLGALANPANDAADMAAVLRKLGFVVDLLVDADLGAMESSLVEFGARLASDPSSLGLFYYAGHGVQSEGVNYLIPVRTEIASEVFVKQKSLALPAILETMGQSRNGLNIVIMDACRDNPFSWTRSASRGLSVVGRQPGGSIVVYATGAGDVAKDGSGRNGLFTKELLANIVLPGIDINEVFRLTGKAVGDRSGGSQIPAVYSQNFERYYLVDAPPAPFAPDPRETPAKHGNASLPLQASPDAGAPSPVPWSQPTLMAVGSTILPMVAVAGGSFVMGSRFGDVDESPEHRVSISSFLIGAHPVSVDEFARVMAVSGYQTTAEIAGFGTVADGPAIVRQSGASWRNPGFHQDASSPVTLVSWFDAARFCNDLSAMEGFKPVYFMGIQGIGADLSRDGYRLPTEAEWEFASRGGIYSRGFRYSGSDFLDEVAWYAGNSSGAPGPRGMKYPNELGLYDMTGSVWEWCHDWYGSYPSSTQENPSGPVSGEYRIMRGGSWNSDADSCRLTNRGGGDPDSRYDVFGFRVLRRESTKGQF